MQWYKINSVPAAIIRVLNLSFSEPPTTLNVSRLWDRFQVIYSRQVSCLKFYGSHLLLARRGTINAWLATQIIMKIIINMGGKLCKLKWAWKMSKIRVQKVLLRHSSL